MGFFDSSSSTTVNETKNQFLDQRSVNDASNGGVVGSANLVDRSNNLSTSTVSNTDLLYLNDNDYAFWQDQSNRSVNNYSGTDPGVLQLAELNNQFLGAAAESNVDGVRALANMGADVLRQSGGAATSLFQSSFSNSAVAWEHTLEAGQGLIEKMLTGAAKTTDAAQAVAQSAISSFQPTPNAQADSMKYAAVAAVGLIALLLLRKG